MPGLDCLGQLEDAGGGKRLTGAVVTGLGQALKVEIGWVEAALFSPWSGSLGLREGN